MYILLESSLCPCYWCAIRFGIGPETKELWAFPLTQQKSVIFGMDILKSGSYVMLLNFLMFDDSKDI